MISLISDVGMIVPILMFWKMREHQHTRIFSFLASFASGLSAEIFLIWLTGTRL